jgi:hypothetical protein
MESLDTSFLSITITTSAFLTTTQLYNDEWFCSGLMCMIEFITIVVYKIN